MGAGARRSVSSAAVSGCASAYPTRREAKPNAFESVRRTTRLGSSSTQGAHERAPYSTYASSATTIACGTRSANAAISSGSIQLPVGLLGLQTQWRSASSPAATTSAPRSVVAIR